MSSLRSSEGLEELARSKQSPRPQRRVKRQYSASVRLARVEAKLAKLAEEKRQRQLQRGRDTLASEFLAAMNDAVRPSRSSGRR